MSESVALFTYPSLTALIRNIFPLRTADKLVLFCHADQRHPSLLNRIFCRLAQAVTGCAVDVRTIQQFSQTPDAIDAVKRIHGDSTMGSELRDWIIDAAGCEHPLATRYVRRIMLERTFISIALDRAIIQEFATSKQLWVLYSHANSNSDAHNVKQIQGIDFLATLFAWIIFPAVSYARLCKAFLSSTFTLKIPVQKKFPLVIYEVAFQQLPDQATEQEMRVGMHRTSNSTLVYSFDPKQTCQFINDIWRPSQDVIDQYKAYLNEQGFNYYDWADSRLSLKRLILLHRYWLFAYLQCLKHLRRFEYVFDAARMIGLYAREQIVFDNVNASAFLAMDDYSDRAIIRTHVARQRHSKTFLIQHSANDGIRSGPELTTVEVDYYLTLSQFARDSFADYWRKENVIEYGYPRIDGVLPEIQSRTDADSPFKFLGHPGKPIVVIALPNIRSHQHFLATLPGAKEFTKFLEIATDRYKGTLNIFLRPKHLAGWEETMETVGFPTENMLLDRDLLTAEYLYFADMAYCSVGSGIMSECALLETNFALFDIVKSPTDIYDHLGKGFFNATAEDMIRQLDLLASGEPMEIDHAEAQRLFSDPYNPNRTRIISDLILDDPVKASKPRHTSTEPLKQAT